MESKAVEAQQDAAANPRLTASAVSQAEAARHNRKTTLMLARTRAEADLRAATAAAHRAMLEGAIADLDREIAALAPQDPR